MTCSRSRSRLHQKGETLLEPLKGEELWQSCSAKLHTFYPHPPHSPVAGFRSRPVLRRLRLQEFFFVEPALVSAMTPENENIIFFMTINKLSKLTENLCCCFIKNETLQSNVLGSFALFSSKLAFYKIMKTILKALPCWACVTFFSLCRHEMRYFFNLRHCGTLPLSFSATVPNFKGGKIYAIKKLCH